VSAAMKALELALVEKEAELKQTKSNTAEAITAGRRAQAELDSAQRQRDEVAEALDILRAHERAKQRDAEERS